MVGCEKKRIVCNPPLLIQFSIRSGVVFNLLFLVLYKLLIKLWVEVVEILFKIGRAHV